MSIRIGVISFLEFRAYLKSLLQCHADRERYHLCQLVALCDRHVKNPCNILNRLSCGKRAESNNMGDSRLAVFGLDIVYCRLSSLIVEIDIEVRHRYSFGVQESLENKSVSDGIDISYSDSICNERTGAGASSRSDSDFMCLGIVYKIPDYEIVIGIAHAVYN